MFESHPSWVRGLKPTLLDILTSMQVSHPSWVRGLKQRVPRLVLSCLFVAPLVGAWIETVTDFYNYCEANVAPLVGAWIETSRAVTVSVEPGSRTPRGCVD